MEEENVGMGNPIAGGLMGSPTCETKEYRPSRMECLISYEISIRFLSIGCLITVGCKTIPFATVLDGMKALNDYIANPYENTKLWEERFNKEQ